MLVTKFITKLLFLADLFGGSRLTESNPPWNGAGHPISPSGLYGTTGLPFPTNVWWQNMVLENGDLINAVNPYIVKTQSDGLHVCLPTKVFIQFHNFNFHLVFSFLMSTMWL